MPVTGLLYIFFNTCYLISLSRLNTDFLTVLQLRSFSCFVLAQEESVAKLYRNQINTALGKQGGGDGRDTGKNLGKKWTFRDVPASLWQLMLLGQIYYIPCASKMSDPDVHKILTFQHSFPPVIKRLQMEYLWRNIQIQSLLRPFLIRITSCFTRTCNFIYDYNNSTTFLRRFQENIRNSQQHHLHISYTEFHPNRTINVESMENHLHV